MHRSEEDQFVNCLHCGSEISLSRDRTFVLSEDGGLCFACSVRRGGRYDEIHDTWTKAPDLSGLDWSSSAP